VFVQEDPLYVSVAPVAPGAHPPKDKAADTVPAPAFPLLAVLAFGPLAQAAVLNPANLKT